MSTPKFHGYTTLMCAEGMGLPYLEALASWARLCSSITVCLSHFPELEIHVPDGAVAPWSEDGTETILRQFVEDGMLGNCTLDIVHHAWDPDEPLQDGYTKQVARAAALKATQPDDWMIQFDADEILRDTDEFKIREHLYTYDNNPDLRKPPFLIAGVLEMFGSADTVRFGFGSWVKIRLTQPLDELQHGLPLRLGPMPVRGRNQETGKIIAIDNRDDGAGFISAFTLSRPDYNVGGWLADPETVNSVRAIGAIQNEAQAEEASRRTAEHLDQALQEQVWIYHTGWVDIARKWSMGWFWDNAWALLAGKQNSFISKDGGSGTMTHVGYDPMVDAEKVKEELDRPTIQRIQIKRPSVFDTVITWRQDKLKPCSRES